MKHTTALIAGALTLLLPAVVAAQCPKTDRAYELAQAQALGHYTQKVLTRVNAAIAKAKTQPGGSERIPISRLQFLSEIQSAFYLMVDTDLRSVEYSRDLTQVNSCLHYDLAVLEAKIEEVRCEILEAYDRNSPDGIHILTATATFLNQRYKHLIKGALQPTHTDKTWSYADEFDDPIEGWCCDISTQECSVKTNEECEQVPAEDQRIGHFYPTKDACLTESICSFATDETARPRYTEQCPFDSDYLTPSLTGYGCDLHVLSEIPTGILPGVDAEVQALRTLAQTRDNFLEDIRHIHDTTMVMDTLVHENMLSEQERRALERFGQQQSQNPQHKRVYGCYADLTPEERNELELPEADETNTGTEGRLTPRTKPAEEWIRLPVRTAFFFRKDHLAIWTAYLRYVTELEVLREFPDYIKNPDEFVLERDRKKAMEKNSLLSVARNDYRDNWQSFQKDQAQQNAILLTKAYDTAVQTKEVMQPVRPMMAKNAQLVSSTQGGMRRFAINYAYFLRRSCIYRPCNEKLDTIMQILFSDACFPYTNNGRGSFEDCMEAVRNLAQD